MLINYFIYIVGVLKSKLFIRKYPEDYEFNLDMYGLKIIAYKDTVAGYDDECEVNIEGRIGEKYRYSFPENARLVSGVYKISISGSKLRKPLKIGIQHSVELRTPSQTKWLRFAITSSNKHSFTLFEGEFSVGNKYGYIERKKFSELNVVEVSNGGPPNNGGSHDDESSSSSIDSNFERVDPNGPPPQQPIEQQPIEQPIEQQQQPIEKSIEQQQQPIEQQPIEQQPIEQRLIEQQISS